MTLNLHKPSKETVALTLTVAVLGALVGSGATYYVMKDSGPTPQLISENTRDPSVENQHIKVSDALNDPGKYKGAAVEVTGRLIETDTDFVVVETEDNAQAGLILKADDKQALETLVDQTVTIKGTVDIVRNAANQPVIGLKVKEIQKT